MRRARVAVPGTAHHITQRGNRRADVFIDAEDRHVYLELLREYSCRRLKIWTYSLMTNHVHLVVVPEKPSSLSDVLRDTHGGYASMFNRKYGFVGHLWQSRFYSCVLDDDHLQHAVRYVERNPVRAAMVARAEDYPWSSAAPHVLGNEDRYLDPDLPLLDLIKDWSAWLGGVEDYNAICAIRAATATGRVCGSEQFVQRIELDSGRTLRPQKRGRKPRARTESESTELIIPSGWRRCAGELLTVPDFL